MSLATFKKKSINKHSSATKISGKPTNQYWIYKGPYGRKGSLSSTIFLKSIAGPDGSTGDSYNASNAGFSINGATVLGGVGQSMRMSRSHTQFKGVHPRGYGGTKGRYPDGPDNVFYNNRPGIGPPYIGAYVAQSTLSTKGMLARRYRWINSGQYPNNWVQPNYTGNLTDSASQGLYIHNLSAASDCVVDTNDTQKYIGNIKTCGSMGCNSTPARGYTMGIQQANAAYTKFLHIPQDSSQRTLRIQRRCIDQRPSQKPFPYAVQTGTGILTGGTSVTAVGSACNTSNTFDAPPAWYLASKSQVQ